MYYTMLLLMDLNAILHINCKDCHQSLLYYSNLKKFTDTNSELSKALVGSVTLCGIFYLDYAIFFHCF